MAAHGHHGPVSGQKSLLGNEWRSVRLLLPYLLEYRGRVALALSFLVSAKLANVSVPLAMKGIVDGLDPKLQVVAVPVALLAAYEIGRASWRARV